MTDIKWSTTAGNLITVCDIRQNLLWFDNSTGKLSLKLSNEQRHSRQIGTIWSLNENTRIYSRFVKKEHFHIIENTYGLNSIVVNHILNDTDIILLYPKRSRNFGYMIPALTVKQKARYKDFGLKTGGCEKQMFYDIKNWEECK